MSEIPQTPASPILSWNDLNLSSEALELIRKAGFESPTPVQAEAIPPAIEGRDVIASAQTGTGKTLSFVTPMVERFAGKQGTYGLVLAPTREIAQQTQAVIDIFGKPRGVRSIVLIGGVDMKQDAEALQTYPQILVATPGRLCDHLDRGNVWLDFIQIIALDEADRMLDMGFSDQLNRIMEDVPKDAQKLLFSATMPPIIDRLATRFMHEPLRVCIGKPVSAATTVEQRFLFVQEESRFGKLRSILHTEPGTLIVFTRSKDMASRLWRMLHSAGVYDATAIHSDLPQKYREQALADFKSGKCRILIATDVAGRGIHVDEVAHVVNYELPMEAEDYVHRIGRTGRAQASGKATSFVTSKDHLYLKQIEKMLGHPVVVTGAPPNAFSRSSRPPGGHRNHRGKPRRRPPPRR